MKLTTLCYIEKDGKYLMLHRTKKKNDLNEGKWVGVGGKFEEGESPEECLLRETFEETGFKLTSFRLRGIVTFVSDKWDDECMFLYTADAFEGEMLECNEGDLQWIDKSEVKNLKMWEGDIIFFNLMEETDDFFSLKLVYDGDALTESRVQRYKN
jgi:8-oxo-dGTP diphosphatase